MFDEQVHYEESRKEATKTEKLEENREIYNIHGGLKRILN